MTLLIDEKEKLLAFIYILAGESLKFVVITNEILFYLKSSYDQLSTPVLFLI